LVRYPELRSRSFSNTFPINKPPSPKFLQNQRRQILVEVKLR
jgi:hypothetical protein